MVEITEEKNPGFVPTVELNHDGKNGKVLINGVKFEQAVEVTVHISADAPPIAIIETCPQRVIFKGDAEIFIKLNDKVYKLVEVAECPKE